MPLTKKRPSSNDIFANEVLQNWIKATNIRIRMMQTKTIRYGPLVTNPGAREWTLAASTFASLAKLSGNNVSKLESREVQDEVEDSYYED